MVTLEEKLLRFDDFGHLPYLRLFIIIELVVIGITVRASVWLGNEFVVVFNVVFIRCC